MTHTGTDPRQFAGGQGLRWTLLANQIAAGASVVLIVLLYLAVARSPWLLSITIPIGGLLFTLRHAIHRVDRGDMTGAIRLHAVSTWTVGIWVTLVVPFIWPTLMLTVLMPLVLAISYIRRRQLIVLILLSVVVVIAVAVSGLTHAATEVTDLSDEWSPWIRHSVVVASLAAVFVMVVVIVWQHHAEADAQAALLRSSRARLASVADEQRRRIERDLHDGAQQRLVGLAVRLGLLSVQLDGTEAAAVRTMSEELTSAIEELRELAHGIYPPLLANEGLGPALRAAGRRSTLQTQVSAETADRYPPDIETALYFCGLEAMQNAAKHAGPTASVRVDLRNHGDAIELRISDDGRGLPTGMKPSGGLLNMHDRVGAVGGNVEIGTGPGGGVQIIASVPVATDQT